MEIFLNAISGGLMAVLIPSTPTCSKYTFDTLVQLMESALMDLVSSSCLHCCIDSSDVRMLITDKYPGPKEKINSFNLPLYLPTLAEMEALVKRNGHFSIERMDPLVRPHRAEASEVMANMTMMHFRAGWEGLIKAHFGSEMVDPVFEHFQEKVMESSVFANPSCNQKAETFILLKRL
ncbi:loganic acid O-methyltransferase-like [Syzygium oleosum]|uniref:loganic acid O-methyltransferase-like n=1 Tax=Syzygium oleosum TaxID=219896 RepID=UPI0024BB435B|nr:loganic acid O-methyltransferase-like [Syzygium oleosum]